jgi:hypothetical protein
MALTIPSYLQLPDIQSPVIRYTWDDWDVERVEIPLEEDIQERLHRISQRSAAAFAIGTAEWILYRFGSLSSDPSPVLRLEAAWAQIVNIRYSKQNDVDTRDWRGPVYGPVGLAVRRAVVAVAEAERAGEPAWRAGSACKVAQHVINDPTPYRKWREQILTRLERLYPLDPDETLGDVVPREAMDPDRQFDPSETETLVNLFLAELPFSNNPFINSPEQMFEQGFEGTPFVLDQEADRRARHDW